MLGALGLEDLLALGLVETPHTRAVDEDPPLVGHLAHRVEHRGAAVESGPLDRRVDRADGVAQPQRELGVVGAVDKLLDKLEVAAQVGGRRSRTACSGRALRQPMTARPATKRRRSQVKGPT